MDLSYIKKIIRLVENSEVDEVEIEEEGKKIRVAKNRNSFATHPGAAFMPVVQHVAPSHATAQQPNQLQGQGIAPSGPPETALAVPAQTKPEVKYHEIRSPIVGTFYRSPAPDADPFVDVGDTVSAGQVLCIVEAMKLMNEIECDMDGKLVKILVDNAKPVEYNQPLFLIEPAS